MPRAAASSPSRIVAGCMTGTSLDGLDVALVRIDGSGLAMQATLLAHQAVSLGPLAADLRRLAEGEPSPPIVYMQAARDLGRLHAGALRDLCDAFDWRTAGMQRGDAASPTRPDFIVAHGQTIWHAPVAATSAAGDGWSSPGARSQGLSWQLFDPWPVVRELGVPVCHDLRQADLVAGGQGAPITPIADWVMFRDAGHPRVIVNLGGICNVTVIGDDVRQTRGGDVGPCNILLDGVVQRLFPGRRYDEDGLIAATGRVVPMLHQAVVIDLFSAIESQRSLGREQFPMSLLDQWVATAKRYERYEDIVASYVAAVSDLVVAGILRHVKSAGFTGEYDVLLAGGGARNPMLVRAIETNDQAGFHCMTIDALGVPVEAREAMAFAVLGALSQDGVPITLPAVTGAVNPGRAGAWAYP